jgi:uncharacterized protein
MTPSPTEHDFEARISQLFVYPLKSCAAVQVQAALLTETGLEWDRNWMVVDENSEFVTQRQLPRMCLIQPQLKHGEMVVRAPGMLALHIALDKVEQACRAGLWGQDCAAYDMGDIAAQWLTDFLTPERPAGVPAPRLRMVRFDPEHRRLSNTVWTRGVEALNQFGDGYPVLVASQASLDGLNQRLTAQGHTAVTMQRFRPNVVLDGMDAHDEDRTGALHIATAEGAVELALVKPCPRCPIPNVNPVTGVPSPQVGDTLQGYRQDPRLHGAVSFGMNAITLSGTDQVLRVGQVVRGRWAFA